MNGGVTSALAAIIGAFVGGFASLASTWVGERSRHRRDLLQREIARRETAYSEFIDQASRLYVASATHHIDDDDAELEGMVSLYAVASRIRLFASDRVMTEAEKVIDRIFMQFGADNISAEQLRMSAVETRDDPLVAFSIVCRHELQDIQRGR
ncbi:MAG TPA: hypothetical protein VFD58_00310 [Blastocatellia bacterium]|nr:hypothetical protein [Blastocatellia bacterium]